VKIYQDETSVSRALCFFQSCSDQTRTTAFSHEWTKCPSSLFEVDSRVELGFTMRKGTKSNYLAALKSFVDPEAPKYPSLPPVTMPTVFLVDAMAFVNRYQFLGAKTFGELTQLYVSQIKRLMPSGCKCVNVVGDRYDFGP
jgi:hypothetical protein